MAGPGGTNVVSWASDIDGKAWDEAVAALFGHPLQSAVWGRARKRVDGIREKRWLATTDGKPIWMIRVEERVVRGVGSIAWAPRGPVGHSTESSVAIPSEFKRILRKGGFSLLSVDPWVRVSPKEQEALGSVRPMTVWLDLSKGVDALFSNFHPQLRKGIRRAERGGVEIEDVREDERIAEFVSHCTSISHRKGFELRVSKEIIQAILDESRGNPVLDAALIVSKKDGVFGSGLFVMRLGRAMHQIWGATNRALKEDRVGEACQWATIRWAIERGCERYDLEGIDPQNNRPVYDFKRRFNGDEVFLHGMANHPLDLRGRALALAIKLRRFW